MPHHTLPHKDNQSQRNIHYSTGWKGSSNAARQDILRRLLKYHSAANQIPGFGGWLLAPGWLFWCVPRYPPGSQAPCSRSVFICTSLPLPVGFSGTAYPGQALAAGSCEANECTLTTYLLEPVLAATIRFTLV